MNPISHIDKLKIPFKSVLHPHRHKIDPMINSWVSSLNRNNETKLWSNTQLLKSSLMTAYAYPFAGKPQLEIVAKWIAWILLVDCRCR